MSLFPHISSARKKENPSGTWPRPKEAPPEEELALPGIHGNEDSNNKRRVNTATLKGPGVLYTRPERNTLQFPAGKMKSSPLKSCQFCGRGFGSASVAIHQKKCQEKLLLKHDTGLLLKDTLKSKTRYTRGPASLISPRPSFWGAIVDERDTDSEFKGTPGTTAARGHKVDLLLQQNSQPFKCACQFCGEKYGKHSLVIHEKKCLQKQLITPADVQERRDRIQSHSNRTATVSKSLDPDASAGLNNPQELVLLPERPKTRTLDCSSLSTNRYKVLPGRPKTRTLDRSSLPANRHEVSSVGSITTPSTTVCDKCGHDVLSGRISVHQRVCKGPSHSVSTGPLSLTFPTLHRMTVRVNSRANTTGGKVETQKVTNRKPPTIVCYICGREYGTMSISIHEPQCLKKWHISNSKLPISQRKPVPKKPSSKVTQVAIVARGDTVTVKGLPTGTYSQQPPDEVIERYFQHCYAEFESELIPCAKCGRTFAPERHVKHTRNCNAKPLKR